MNGGMRIENVRELPGRYQEQAAVQILERLAAAAPDIQEELRKLEMCPACGFPGVTVDRDNGLRFCTECGWNRTRKEWELEQAKTDPCLDCLRWGECNGVDETCPLR